MIYVVESGDTLYSIAERFQTSADRIAYDNQVEGRTLVPGEALWILGTETEEGTIRPLLVSGYAYPYIMQPVLAEALDHIDEFLLFSYGFTVYGELIPPGGNELALIEQSWQSGVEPFLVLTPFGEDQRFNNYLVKLAVTDGTVKQNLINNLLYVVRDRGYAGVDVDFEYILPEDREAYAAFVGELRAAMNSMGYKVSVALAPKIAAGQPGLLYEGMDYRMLGESADWVFLMTYEWGYV